MDWIYLAIAVIAGVLGWIIWDHKPDLQSLLGMVLVMGGGVTTLLVSRSHRSARNDKPEAE